MLHVACLLIASFPGPASPQDSLSDRFEPMDVFGLEYASDPRLAPDGKSIVYVRNSMDVMADRSRSNLWTLRVDGSEHRPLAQGSGSERSPRFSPDGRRLLYVAAGEHGSELHVRWLDSGQTARISDLDNSPSSVTWSPDGKWIAFLMAVEIPPEPFVQLPRAPEGATWAPAPRVITELHYRSDGQGYLDVSYRQLFVLPAEGGTPRQLTEGAFDVDGPLCFTPDGQGIVFSSNRREEAEFEPLDSELYLLTLADRELRPLTARRGPDSGPALSPDGKYVAYTGFDDRRQGYQVEELSLLSLESGVTRVLTPGLDRDVQSPTWDPNGERIWFSYDDRGDTHLAFVNLAGELTEVSAGLGGLSLGRPYGGSAFHVGPGGVTFTHTTPWHPADVAYVAVGDAGIVRSTHLTRLNEDLLGHKELGAVSELTFSSSHDGRALQGWVVKPPGFDPEQRYPLLLEIHGGPFANYGTRFAAEIQLYAAAGYVVLYMNPRGSTSYGGEFGNLIHHAYPGNDYDDLLSGVEAVLAQGFVDPERLFVTGGSGGGVLTAWIVGKTDRFRAAVVAKPVIHWTSFVLTADAYPFFTGYWFPGMPWELPEHYWQRSPLSLVGNVTTPTMLLTGEADYRTPISESEQYYQALKLRKIDAALVRIPEASHGIAARPSHLIAKVAHILAWFARHDEEGSSSEG